MGILRAGAESKLSRAVAFKGVAKKIVMFFLVGIANIIDVHLLDSKLAFKVAITFFYNRQRGHKHYRQRRQAQSSNPEIMDANGVPESLSIMFHKDNCSVIAIQGATEYILTGADLVANLNSLRLFSRFQLDREALHNESACGQLKAYIQLCFATSLWRRTTVGGVLHDKHGFSRHGSVIPRSAGNGRSTPTMDISIFFTHAKVSHITLRNCQ